MYKIKIICFDNQWEFATSEPPIVENGFIRITTNIENYFPAERSIMFITQLEKRFGV